MATRFYLENEKQNRIDLMSKKHFFNSPTGLGFDKDIRYAKTGNAFIVDYKDDKQSIIKGNIIFIENPYDNYKKVVDFIEQAEHLKLVYVPNYEEKTKKEYFRDIEVSSLTKGEIVKGALTSSASFNCKSLFYTAEQRKFIIEYVEDEPRFDVANWGITFNDYDDREIIIDNKGHVEAAIKIEMNGYLINPKIELRQNNKLIGNLEINDTIEVGEKLFYSTQEGNLYLYKLVGNARTNLIDTLDLHNNNFFKLPKGISTIRLTAENGVETKTTLDVLIEYKAV